MCATEQGGKLGFQQSSPCRSSRQQHKEEQQVLTWEVVSLCLKGKQRTHSIQTKLKEAKAHRSTLLLHFFFSKHTDCPKPSYPNQLVWSEKVCVQREAQCVCEQAVGRCSVCAPWEGRWLRGGRREKDKAGNHTPYLSSSAAPSCHSSAAFAQSGFLTQSLGKEEDRRNEKATDGLHRSSCSTNCWLGNTHRVNLPHLNHSPKPCQWGEIRRWEKYFHI